MMVMTMTKMMMMAEVMGRDPELSLLRTQQQRILAKIVPGVETTAIT